MLCGALERATWTQGAELGRRGVLADGRSWPVSTWPGWARAGRGLATRPEPVSAHGARVVSLGERPGVAAADRTHLSPFEVVGTDVDPSEQSRKPGLVGRVVVARPLQRDVLGRAELDLEFAGGDGPLSEPAGEVGTAREPGHHLGSCAAERAVTRDVAREGRCHECPELVRHPVDREDPVHPGRLRGRILRVPLPGTD